MQKHIAKFYEKNDDGSIKCQLCPHRCVIKEGRSGLCRVRKNIDKELIALSYGKMVSANLDPIEKKPLYHFFPGKNILSVGTLGCNFNCFFCQNWSISQQDISATSEGSIEYILPVDLVKIAGRQKTNNNLGIAYTYNEPLIGYEFVLDTAILAKKNGLKNVLVTNGYINEEPLKELLPYIDALNIDIKSIEDDFYKKYCRGSLNPVLKTCEIANKSSLVEITNLIIPGLNDSEKNIKDLSEWVYNNLGKDTPLHLSAYRPEYKCNIKSTPVETIKKAYEIASEKLNYVYAGNVYCQGLDDTNCPKCGELLIERMGYSVNIKNLKDSHCGKCDSKINIQV